MNRIKLIAYKIKNQILPKQITSKEYVDYLQTMGIDIGKGTHFFSPYTTNIDTQRPWMLKIGEYCKITSGVIILAHDYSRSVIRRKYGEIVGEARDTVIGNNVFIGMNSIICMGSHIGNNVIVGAGSVIAGDIPDNSVVGGCQDELSVRLKIIMIREKIECLTKRFFIIISIAKSIIGNQLKLRWDLFFRCLCNEI